MALTCLGALRTWQLLSETATLRHVLRSKTVPGCYLIFQHTSPGSEAAWALVKLRQSKRKVTDYTSEFQTLAADSEWNTVLVDAFFRGCLETVNRPSSLHGFTWGTRFAHGRCHQD